MKNTKKVQIVKEQVVSITCDRCKIEVNADDVFEFQEIISIKIEGGFSSIFGDGNVFEIDICQKCVKETVGEYMRHTGNYIWGNKVLSGDALSKIADLIEQEQPLE